VDFSIHEIQHGSSVVEAVIQACKTRTRPILITALALVCGSSVIFFDPIFQGMAISLASGVMVSTILTLIVIPLGCIKASKDLIEVATVTAPAGVEMPVLEDTSRTRQETEPQKPAAAARTPLWMVLWSKLFAVISMLFYLVRGIFLMLFQLFKKKPKPAKTTPAGGGASGSTGGAGSSGGGQSAGGGNEPAASSNPPVSKVSQAAVVGASADVVVEKKPPQRSDVEQERVVPPQAGASSDTKSAKAEVKKEDGDTQVPMEQVPAESAAPDKTAVDNQAGKPVSTVPEAKQAPATPKAKKRPSTLQSQKVTKEASQRSTKQGSGSPKTGKKSPASAVQDITAIPMKKKAGRRGIRLKT
jgi:hypothetical protein